MLPSKPASGEVRQSERDMAGIREDSFPGDFPVPAGPEYVGTLGWLGLYVPVVVEVAS